MIFGFNTEIKQGETVYHVQSEARESELLLQTQVFVGGRCVGKRALSYADLFAQEGFSDERMHEMLKSQHRSVLDAIREGRLESVLGAQGAVQDVGGQGLGLEFIRATAQHDQRTVILRFLVTDHGSAAAGARVSARSAAADSEPTPEVSTSSEGLADVIMIITPAVLQDVGVLVNASYSGKSATRKFRLRKHA